MGDGCSIAESLEILPEWSIHRLETRIKRESDYLLLTSVRPTTNDVVQQVQRHQCQHSGPLKCGVSVLKLNLDKNLLNLQ